MSVHPSMRAFALLLGPQGQPRDTSMAMFGGTGAPSGGTLPNGQTLASGQQALYLRCDASTVATLLYGTVDGGTTWTAFDPAALSGLDVNGTEFILDADGDTSITADTDDEIDIRVGGADVVTITATDISMVAAMAVTGQGSTVAPVLPIAAQQALSGAGAVNVTTYYTAWTTTAADAGTLADGAQKGQLKKIQLVVDGGDGTLTPTNLNGGTTITFADAGDYAVLMWSGSGWTAIELGNDADGASAPVLA